MHRLLKRAIMYARQTRNKFSLREVAAEMGLGRPGERRHSAGSSSVKRAMWRPRLVAPSPNGRAHPAPDAQTQA